MKKILIGLCTVLACSAALADGPGGFRYREWHHHDVYRGNDWVGPMILGGVIGYELSRPRPAPPTVIYAPPPVIYSSVPPAPPYGYHYEQILDANCNCYRTVLAPN